MSQTERIIICDFKNLNMPILITMSSITTQKLCNTLVAIAKYSKKKKKKMCFAIVSITSFLPHKI